VAADDALRAVSLMLANTAGETGDEDSFVGHLDQTSFVVVIQSSQVQSLQTAVKNRIQPSIQYFYPLKDRERAAQGSTIRIATGIIQAKGEAFSSVDEMKTALLRTRRSA
jgi:GGDEF domain-containing protein